MLLAVSVFVPLEWDRFHLWLLARGGRRGRVRGDGHADRARSRARSQTASLLAFTLLLPVAFLALVPVGGRERRGSTTSTRVVSALFPFEPDR